ncbi:MAG: alpha/beta hydrolase [Proteobacteria bacterium]|nr:MAG: alpha/beta hydrolase [Pseudomonadota bacterium]
MSPETKVVFAYLRNIQKQAFELLRDLPARRELIESYFAIDPSTHDVEGRYFDVNAGGVSAEWVLADNANPNHRLLYIHGGSWVSGSPASYRGLTSRISRATACAVLSIDYRLAPENPFPAGLNDCCDAYQWMLENGPNGVAPAEKSVICGDSAGGNLSLSSVLRLQDLGVTEIDAAIAISPAVDFRGRSPSIKTRADRDPIIHPAIFEALKPLYLPEGQDIRDPYVSPLLGDLSQFPPLLLQVGDAEVLLDESTRMAEKLKLHNRDVTLEVWDEMPHVFQGFAPYLPEASLAIQSIGDFVQRQFNPA